METQTPVELPFDSRLKLPSEQPLEQPLEQYSEQQLEQQLEQRQQQLEQQHKPSQFASLSSASPASPASFAALSCFVCRAASPLVVVVVASAPINFCTSHFDRALSFSVSTISRSKQRTRFSRTYWDKLASALSLRAFPRSHSRGERPRERSKTRTSEKLKRRNTRNTTSAPSEQSATQVSTVSTLQREKLQAKRRRTQPPVARVLHRGFRLSAQRVRHVERALVDETPAHGADVSEIRGNPADSGVVAAVLDVQHREVCSSIVETEVPSSARRFREVGRAMRNCCSIEYAMRTSNSKRPSHRTAQRDRLEAALRTPERTIRE